MKKVILFFSLVLSLAFFGNASAPICNIAGGDNSVVYISSSYDGAGAVTVKVSNDSNESVNIEVSVNVEYQLRNNFKENRTYTGRALAAPNGYSDITVAVPAEIKVGNNVYQYNSFDVTSITGRKCQ
ncbi:MAG: hypothetical protein NC111_00620 [Bacteroides sp.]|nr:hypothetical protein [Bacteroides sp.]MCM1414155.1 hypothetical protein [Bacteroides sp.]MCM1471021.1 hypothetical protein [Bacteroides sp.]